MKTEINLKKMPGWNFYGDASLSDSAPKGEGKLELFTLGKRVSDSELSKEYESRGLIPAHPELIAEYVLANPDFKERYIGTHWYDDAGEWCFATFYRWHDERYVVVGRRGCDWLDYWWFGGCAKSALGTSESSTEPSSDTQSLSTFDEISTTCQHTETGIKAELSKGLLTITNKSGAKNFIFQSSTPETVRKVGQALLDISNL